MSNEVAATIDQPQVAEKPGTQIGPYKLREQIGEGGFGVVYVAEQEQPVARKVALKIIKPGMDTQDVIARFEAERQALALMEHPNVARVLDAGATNSGRPYFVMELVKGVPITEFCDEQKLSTDERLRLFVDTCRAVQHAHQKGIIHRDLKPSNIMVTMRDDKPVVKVIDFGVSKALSRKLTDKTVYTAYGQMIGTPLYMSPEQAQMSEIDVDTRSDVYSLGVLLYELLTGTTPFDRETLKKAGFDELRRIIREDEPPRPSARVSTLKAEALSTVSDKRKIDTRKLGQSYRGELDWIVMKALEKDRNRRYESASAFAADVERYLADEPVLACPPSVWYRFSKFARRKKATLGFASLIVLFVVALGSGAGWVVRDRKARDDAAERERIALEEKAQRERQDKQRQLAARVEFVLGEVSRHKQAEDWDSARQANKRAGALLDSVDGHWKLKDRIHAHQTELEFVARLQAVRERRHPVFQLKQRLRQDRRDVQEYEAIFRDFGIDVVKLPRNQAARRLKRHAEIISAAFTGLDDWAALRDGWLKDPKGAAALRLLANAIDKDPWRRKLRLALVAGDGETLKKLASSEDLLEQPATSLFLLGSSLAPVSKNKPTINFNLGVRVLRKAQIRYPRSFRLNNYLGALLLPYHTKDALPYLQAAHSLRPQVSITARNLAVAWGHVGYREHSIDLFRFLLRRDPKSWRLHAGMATVYEKKKDYESALKYLQLGLNARPPRDHIPNFQYRVALQLRRLKCTREAVAWYKKAIPTHKAAILRKYANGSSSFGKLFEQLVTAAVNAKVDVRPFLVKVLEDHPNSAAAYWGLLRAIFHRNRSINGRRAIARYKRKNIESSIPVLEAACRRSPENVFLHDILDDALRDLGDPDYASFWEKTVAANPKWWVAHDRLSNRYHEFDRWKDAIRHLRLAHSLNKQQRYSSSGHSSGGLYRWLLECPKKKLRDPHQATRLLEMRKVSPPLSAAMAYVESGKVKQARKVLAEWKAGNQWSAKRPIKPPSSHFGLRKHYLLAMVHWKFGDKKQAWDWFLSAVLPARIGATEPVTVTIGNLPYAGRGEPRVNLQHRRDLIAMIPPKEIAAECTRRLKDGDDAACSLARGEALARLKQFDAAAADFVKLLSLVRPEKHWTARQRIIYQRLAEFPEVVQRVAQSLPKDIDVWIEVGRHHASFGRWRQAADAYGKVLTKKVVGFRLFLRPSVEYAGVLLLAGDGAGYQRVCKQIVNRIQATGIFSRTTLAWAGVLGANSGVKGSQLIAWGESALSLAKRDGSLQADLLGLAHYRNGEYRKAIEAFDDARTIRDKPLAVTAFGLAMAWHKLGDKKESRRWYDFAVLLHNAAKPTADGLPCRQLHIDNWITENVLYREAKALIERVQ